MVLSRFPVMALKLSGAKVSATSRFYSFNPWRRVPTTGTVLVHIMNGCPNPRGSAAPPRDGSGRLPWALEWAGEVGNGKKTKYHPMLGVERVGKGLGVNC